jgi:hypothetical protein
MIRPFLAALLIAAAPAAAQIVVVPLDPVDPGEVLPPADPNAQGGFVPIDPGAALPSFPLPDDQGGFVDLLEPPPPGSMVGDDVTTVQEDQVTRGTGAVLKGLDKLAGSVEDLTLKAGETVGLGWLQITLGECRYPVDNPSGDAYAWLVIREKAGEAPIFQGWMIASSPALNALDHSRFDVWVSHCTTE